MRKELQRAEKIVSRIHELASISEDMHGITRRYGTEAFVKAGNQVLEWMRAAGLLARIDAIGNVRGILKADDEAARTLVIASHIDTVINAGRWDGSLGVVMGLDLVENIIQEKEKLPFHIELIAFCDEEGARFHTTYLGSKVVAGSFDRGVLNRKDEEGATLEEAIRKIGGDAAKLDTEAIAPDKWLGYFEIHIEQGPVLYEKKIPVAPVKAIAGQIRAEAVFRGVAGHAGTVPMEMRADALCGASEFILEVERLVLAAGGALVATVGKLQIVNPASNVIPGEVTCSVDIRSADAQVLSRSHEKIRVLCAEIGKHRSIVTEWRILQESLPVTVDHRMNALLEQSILEAGYETLPLVSGAGHDAVPVSAVSPVCMLFVRCFKGISHHPLEDVETEDIAAAIAVTGNFIHQLTEIWKYQP